MLNFIFLLFSCYLCHQSVAGAKIPANSNTNAVNNNANSNKELDIITNKINALGLPYYIHDETNNTKNKELKFEIQNSIVVIAHEIVKSIDWEEVIQNIDFHPPFDLSLEGIDSSQRLSLLQATMFSFTASTDMIIAISNIPELRMIMNISNESPQYSSIQYIKKYLFEQDDRKFQLKRYEKAVSQLMNQAIERVSNSRKAFIKQISEFVESLHDCYKVKENIEYDANDEPVPVAIPNRTYRIEGPSAREINTQISKLVTSYIYMPLVVGCYESTLFYHFPELSIEDVNDQQRNQLLIDYARIEAKLSKAVKKSKPQRVKEYAVVIKEEIDRLYEFYMATHGNNWNNRANWFKFPSFKSEEEEQQVRDATEYVIEVDEKIIREVFTYEAIHQYIKKQILNCKSLQATYPCISDEALELNAVYHVFFENWFGLVLSTDPFNPGFIEIKLDHNNLNGKLSNEILRLSNSSLLKLDVSYNKLNNDFSDKEQLLDFSTNKKITSINMASNQLVGKVPTSIYRTVSNSDLNTELVHLDMSHNKLTGTLSANIAKCSNLQVIQLSHNKMHGTIPRSLETIVDLSVLDLSYNKFTSTIPKQLWSLTSLNKLYLNDNKFVGALPNTLLIKATSLQELKVQHNMLQGTLPIPKSLTSNTGDETVAIPLIQHLDFGYNQFTSTISSSLNSMMHLSYLDVGYNKLTGDLPELSENVEFRYYGNADLD